MSKCNFHDEKESIGQCKICGAKLCKSCDAFQEQFGRCPNCAKQTVEQLHYRLKNGMARNILSVVFAGLFLIMFIVYLCLGELSTSFIVIGSVIIAVLLPLTIFMMIYNIKNIKRLDYFLKLADKNLENNVKNQNDKIDEK